MKRPGVFEGDLEQCEPRQRRKRGEGRLWKIGRIYWIQYYAHGRQVRESTHSEKEDIAERLLAKRLAEIDADTFVGPATRRLRYEQIRDALYDDYETNHRRWLRIGKNGERYICGVHHLDVFFTGQRVFVITTGRIREFIAARQSEGATNGTINRELALLRRMFNLALEDGTLRSIPHFPMLKEASPRKGFLEFAEFQALRRELPEYLRSVATMAYYTGMRLGEMLNIRWENADLEAAEIRLEPGTTKNDEPRTIPLIGELAEMLKIERDKSTGTVFIFMRNGRRISSFYKAWKSACQRAGLKGLLFHDLRRTGIRNLVRANVPERVAMAISGHKTRAVFDRYNIVSGRDLKEAAGRLETYLAAQDTKEASRGKNRSGANSGQFEKIATNKQRSLRPN